MDLQTLIVIYKTLSTCKVMKLSDVLGKVVQNKKNGQQITTIRKNKLKKAGLSTKDLMDMEMDCDFKKILYRK